MLGAWKQTAALSQSMLIAGNPAHAIERRPNWLGGEKAKASIIGPARSSSSAKAVIKIHDKHGQRESLTAKSDA